MTPTTTTAEPPDYLDPWGFGRSSADDRTAVIEFFEPLDEPVDDDAVAINLTGYPPPAPVAAARPAPVAAPHGRGTSRSPFPRQMLAVMGLFGAIILAQAFYIGFSLTGEASARVDVGDVVIPPPPTAAQVSAGPTLLGTPPLAASLTAGQHETAVVGAAGVPQPTPSPASPATGPVAGWVRIDSPFEVQVFEHGELVGTSATPRLLMPAGPHVLELVNTTLGYRASVKAVVTAGGMRPIVLDTPRVPVAVNAQPWAEVVVGGRVLGETPMADLTLPIGVHEMVLRHPDLGARTETVIVRATGANRVSVDLRR